MKSVEVGILDPLSKSGRVFQYIVVIGNRLTNLLQIVPLGCIRSEDAAQAFLEH